MLVKEIREEEKNCQSQQVSYKLALISCKIAFLLKIENMGDKYKVSFRFFENKNICLIFGENHDIISRIYESVKPR